MDIFCPHCQNHLSIEDEHAGQYLKCPLCSGQFTAPALMTISPPPPPAVTPAPQVVSPQVTPPYVTPPTIPLVPVTEGASPEQPLQRKEIFPQFDLPGPTSPPATIPPPLPSGTAAPPAATMAPPAAVPSAPVSAPGPMVPPLPSQEDEGLEPLPEGEYRRAFILHFNPVYLGWFGVVGLGLVFFFSFFTWFAEGARESGANYYSPWGLAFSRRTGASALFVLYVMLLLVSLILAVVAMLLTKRIITLPEPFRKVRAWRSLLVAGVAMFSFIFLFFHWLSCTFSTPDSVTANGPVVWWFTTIWYKLAVRVHFLAVVGLLLEFWLDRRHKKNLPLPKIEMRW